MTAPERIDGLRVIRLVVMFNSGANIVLAVLITVAFFLNGDRVDQINQERVRNTVASCVRDSVANQQIINFLQDAGAREETLERADRFFPTLSQDQCERRARETIRK